jgi:predicted amidohydrolase
MKVALLHLAPVPGEITSNRCQVEAAIGLAAGCDATWVITPEFCVTGFAFHERIGTDWIEPQPDAWMRDVARLAARLEVTVFLSCPERDPTTDRLHNSVFVIGQDGAILGRHRKINTLRVGSESWSTPGDQVAAIPVEPLGPVGVLVCADAHSPWIAARLGAEGARLLVSPAAWAPGLHGPDGEWERCSRDTGLPLIVCNRTGPDEAVDFSQAESVIVGGGQRVLSLRASRSAVFTVDWDPTAPFTSAPAFQTAYLQRGPATSG